MSGLLEQVFAECFGISHGTDLIGGAQEPLYRPADADCNRHRIYYRDDYFASALHEVAHWCIAGNERRQQLDYGYWYAPDGRDESQQRAFEQVEVKPQALEWHFALASGHAFRISADNLKGTAQDNLAFSHAVRQQALAYCTHGLPPRAQLFRQALAARFGGIGNPDVTCFARGEAA